MKKSLLFAFLGASLIASAQSEVSLSWVNVATVSGGKQTTVHQPVVMEDGKIISVETATGTSDFKFGATGIDLKDEGTTISPNLIINGLNSDGTVNWTINSVKGGINYNSGSLAVLPGKDLAMAVFSARFNAKGDKSADVVKMIDATGKYFSIPMTCPDDFNPYKGAVLTFKPSTGEIVSLKAVESVYAVNGTNVAQPLYLQGVAAVGDCFYVTGYAYTETTFPGGIKFTPAKVPAGWDGKGTVGNGFTVKFNSDAVAAGIAETALTQDDREGNYLISADGSEIVVIGLSNSSLLYFNYDSDLKEITSSALPFSEASNGSHAAILKEVNVSGNDIYVTGHLAGGFAGTNIATTGTSSNQFGFVVGVDRTTGKITGGGVEPAFISGYYGAYKNAKDNVVYAVGYNMNQKVIFLQPYTAGWEKKDRIELFKTTLGMPALWPTAFNSVTNDILVAGRTNKEGTFGSTAIGSGVTAFSGFLGAYNISNFDLASVDSAISDNVSEKTAIYGGNGTITVNAPVATVVNLYSITGSLVRSVSVPAGVTSVNVPAGFYIAAGQKVIVR